MKYIFTTIIIATLAITAAAQDEDKNYFTAEEMPNALKWLPAPPDTVGPHFAWDIMQYLWGKEQRLDPERGPLAIVDAEWGMSIVEKEFSKPFGLQISKEDTPEIYRLLALSIYTADDMAKIPKTYYMRRRPFMRMHEGTSTPSEEKYLRTNGSYPSGHTILGWITALLMTEINPDCAEAVLARALTYGESRVIVGAHWQSDVDAGYLMASAAYAKLHTSDRFLDQMRKAQKEFKKKTKKQ